MEHRLRGKGGGPTGLLGSLGPHPWLFEAAGQQNHHPGWFATGVADTGCLVPDSGCLAQRAHRAEPMFRVLGFLVVYNSSGKQSRSTPQGHWQNEALPHKGIVDRVRGVCSAPHGLSR